jgi:glycosyltransferase involved in cell wall biosynthesis
LGAEAKEAHQDSVHIAIIVNSYPPRLGGLESHVFQMANELTSLGAKVTVICLASDKSDSVEDGVRVIRLRMHLNIASVISFPAWGTSRRLGELLADERVDVVSTHTRFFPMSYIGLRAAKSERVPVIHTEHGAGFVSSPSKFIRFASRVVDLTLGRTVLRKASQVLAVSEPGVRFVAELASVNAEVFYNALRLEDWPVAEDDHSPNSIAYLGRLVGGKGWEVFVDVAAELILRRGFGDLVVHVLGDGPDFESLRARILSCGIEKSVQVHGRADVQTIRTALHGSVLVNPSRLAEGFQITLLEAAAAGAQIVSFPVPSVQPLISDGGPVREVADKTFGSLVDVVADTLRNPRPAMSRRTLEARWSWTVRAREYLAIVDTVVAREQVERARDSGTGTA